MGSFTDSLILKQEFNELDKYLNSRGMSAGDITALLHAYLDKLNVDITINILAEMQKRGDL